LCSIAQKKDITTLRLCKISLISITTSTILTWSKIASWDNISHHSSHRTALEPNII